ncbi:MAG: hypothetical protein IKV20_05415 [Clostridia bacterium]|nr:hypothetical protein [Clostridia bacterium]
MKKETKNIITREWVEKELRFNNTANIKSSLALWCIFTLLCLPMTIAVIYGVVRVFDNPLFEILLSTFMGVMISSPIWVYFFFFLKTLRERSLLTRGEFAIDISVLSYKSEERVRRTTEEFFHFGEYNKISVGHTAFQLASPGDTYYIVHYKAKKEIKFLYPEKLYELQ